MWKAGDRLGFCNNPGKRQKKLGARWRLQRCSFHWLRGLPFLSLNIYVPKPVLDTRAADKPKGVCAFRSSHLTGEVGEHPGQDGETRAGTDRNDLWHSTLLLHGKYCWASNLSCISSLEFIILLTNTLTYLCIRL